jgi:hypothetical protein
MCKMAQTHPKLKPLYTTKLMTIEIQIPYIGKNM